MRFGSCFRVVFAPDGGSFCYRARRIVRASIVRGPRGWRVVRDWTALPDSQSVPMAISADGQIVVTSNARGEVAGLDTATGETRWTAGPFGEGAAVFTPHGLVFASWNGLLCRLHPATGEMLAARQAASTRITASADGTLILATRRESPSDRERRHPARLCRLDPETLALTELGLSARVFDMSLAPDGSALVAQVEDGGTRRLRRIAWPSLEPEVDIDDPLPTITAAWATWTADSRFLGLHDAPRERTITLRDARTLAPVRKLPPSRSSQKIAFSPCGRWIALPDIPKSGIHPAAWLGLPD